MNRPINQRETFFPQKNNNERIIKSRMYNDLAWTSNLLSIFMKITFHYKLSNSAQRKIFSRFLIIFGQFRKKKKNLAKWKKLCSGHHFNRKISLFLSYWTMIDVIQTNHQLSLNPSVLNIKENIDKNFYEYIQYYRNKIK